MPECLRARTAEPSGKEANWALEYHSANWYVLIMWRETARRLFVLVLSVALATGLVARAVQAASPETAVTAMSGDMPMHGKCNGCAGSEKAMPSAACAFAFCGMVAVVPVTATFDPVATGTIEPAVQWSATGHVFPPDPYPPRPAVLT